MATITNFVQGNFILHSPDSSSELQNPIWVVASASNLLAPRSLRNSLITKCLQDNKPLIHLDIGLNSLTRFSQQKSSRIVSDSGLVFTKTQQNKPYYLVVTSIKERCEKAFLLNLAKKLNHSVENCEILKKDRANSGANANAGYGLLIEGIEGYFLLNKSQLLNQNDAESFVSSLPNFSPKIKQIVVFCYPPLLSPELNYVLERSSTCLTLLTSFRENVWTCRSTVRRYTGYSNEQLYTIKLTPATSRVKVTKVKTDPKIDQETKQQKQMINALGFVVKKDEQAREQEKGLREMIFPHLQKIKHEECGCGKTCGGDCKCSTPTEDLIILDDEQEDDDDVDV